MGFFLMTLAGISYWELRFHRISGSEEIIQDLGMRVIGSLPIMSDQSRGLRNNGDGVPDFDALVLDSIDAIRTMLLCDDSNNSHRILMVTSAKGREGKTTLASHLATSIARTGRKTLLVDCDLRRPSVHRLFGAEVQAGLSEVLGGEVDIAHAIIPSPIRDLSLLQAGRQTRETIPALCRTRFACSLASCVRDLTLSSSTRARSCLSRTLFLWERTWTACSSPCGRT